MSLQPLSPGQQRILEAYVDLLVSNGRAPTHDELMAATGIASRNGIAIHLGPLARKGWLVPSLRLRGQPLLTLEAARQLRSVTAVEDGRFAAVRLLHPEVYLSPAEAQALAGQLLAAADSLQPREVSA